MNCLGQVCTILRTQAEGLNDSEEAHRWSSWKAQREAIRSPPSEKQSDLRIFLTNFHRQIFLSNLCFCFLEKCFYKNRLHPKVDHQLPPFRARKSEKVFSGKALSGLGQSYDWLLTLAAVDGNHIRSLHQSPMRKIFNETSKIFIDHYLQNQVCLGWQHATIQY